MSSGDSRTRFYVSYQYPRPQELHDYYFGVAIITGGDYGHNDADCVHEQLSVITDLLVIFHLQDTIPRISNELTIVRSCNVCSSKAYLISAGHINLQRAISYDPW